MNVLKQDLLDRAAFSEVVGAGELDKSDVNAMDQAHHIYTYNIEVKEAVQVDLRLDFNNSKNIEVQDDENVITEEGNKIVVASVMPMTSLQIASVKAYDTDWIINCHVTMVKKSAPIEVQKVTLSKQTTRLDEIINNAKREWKTEPICLMTEQEIRAKVKEQIA